MSLLGAATPGQSGSVNDGNEEVLQILHAPVLLMLHH